MATGETSAANVKLEEQRPAYRRYRHANRRWEVHGECDYRGDCLIGAVIENERGEPEQVRDHQHIAELQERLGRFRIDSELDVPVAPEFDTCCGADLFTYVELEG